MLIALFAISCTKKVSVTGKITGGSPLERIEFIESSGVATLPLVNLGVDKNGSFSGDFEAPKNGIYIISYAGKQGAIYLKTGQKLNISGKSETFPAEYTIAGDAKNNNDFMKETQKFLQSYAGKVNIGEVILKDEKAFIAQVRKIQADLDKNIDEVAKKYNADSDAVQWKKDENKTSLLGLLSQYEMNHAQAIQNPGFKVSKIFNDFQDELTANNDRLVQQHPAYRNYLLNRLNPDFQKFAMAQKNMQNATMSEMFAKYLSTNKDLSQISKDYLLAFVLAQSDIHPGAPKKDTEKVSKLIEDNIKDAAVKKDLKAIQFVINGLSTGNQLPDNSLLKQDGSKVSLGETGGKPTLVMFYASWNPYIREATVSVLRDVVNFYKSKMNFAYVNLDDTKEQFAKTSSALLKGLPGTNLYAENGINSKFAKDLGIYGFKLPGFLVLNKDGKIEGRYFVNLGDPDLVNALNKVSGLTAPVAPPLPNDFVPTTDPQSVPAPAGK